MAQDIFRDFLDSADTLRVYLGKRLVFASKKEQLLPLREYLAGQNAGQRQVTVYDKVMGNAAALLSVLARAIAVYSPLGSGPAVKTLEKHGIEHHIGRVVPCIMRADGQAVCPMEQLSLGKEPEEFYEILRERIEQTKEGQYRLSDR